MENEEWRDVVGYEGLYQVSNHGRIKSLKRRDSMKRLVKEKILTPRRHTSGYLRVQFSKKDYYIHRLVAFSFIPKINGKNEINHIDGDKTNNYAANLEWCNRQENNKHSFIIGLRTSYEMSRIARSEKHIFESKKRRKLTDSDVIDLLTKRKSGISYGKLGLMYGIDSGAIYQICAGKTYKEVFMKWRIMN